MITTPKLKVGDKVRVRTGAWKNEEGVVFEDEDGFAWVALKSGHKDGWPRHQIELVEPSTPSIETVQAEANEELFTLVDRLDRGLSVRLGPSMAFAVKARALRKALQPEPEQLYRVYDSDSMFQLATAEEVQAYLTTGVLDRLAAHVHPLDENGRAVAELSEDELEVLLEGKS